MTVGSTNSHLPVDFTRSVVRSWERDMGGERSASRVN